MSQRLAAGLWIVRNPHGEIVEDVLCGLQERARARLEEIMQVSWDSLAQLGYTVVETDIWSLH